MVAQAALRHDEVIVLFAAKISDVDIHQVGHGVILFAKKMVVAAHCLFGRRWNRARD